MATDVDAMTGVEVIEREECVRLLAGEEIGRVGFVNGSTPEILPVNYALDGDAVVFATASGSKLRCADRGPITFEVDHLDTATRSGWSVVVHGDAHEVTDLDAPRFVEVVRSLVLHPWARGERSHFVRIEPRVITGRRVGRCCTRT